jgi:hypothetical protein
MKSIILACLSCLALLTFQADAETAKNEFPIVIEGVKCSVKAYRPTTAIILEPLVDKNSLPKSDIIIAIMLTNSDISSHMSDDEVSKFTGTKLEKDQIEQHRVRMREVWGLTGPNAAESYWKGVNFEIGNGFIVDSEMGKFLVYELSAKGKKGATTGSIIHVDGRWVFHREKDDKSQRFQSSMLQLVPAEFAKLHEASSVEALPFEDLLK